MTIRKTFANNMRLYRKAAHLTQEDLAVKAGLHRTYIGGIEQQRVNVSLKNIGKIADALHIDPALLFIETSDGKPLSCPTIDPDTLSSDEYALVSWSQGGVTVQPLDSRYDDLTVQVLLDLIDRGYSGSRLIEAYRHAYAELRSFLQQRTEPQGTPPHPKWNEERPASS